MEDLMREKLLCVLRNEIHNFQKVHSGTLFIKDGDIDIRIYSANVYKNEIRESQKIIKPKYFWQKEKTIETVENISVIDYWTWDVSYNGYTFRLNKEEYEELSKLRGEKLKEKALKDLEKLCKNN